MNKYELHITVDPKEEADEVKADLHRDAIILGGKVIDIELSNGMHKHQLMLGINFETKERALAFYRSGLITGTLAKKYKLLRVKLEGHPDNKEDIVQPLYLEAHWKVKKTVRREDLGAHSFDILTSFNRDQSDIKYLTIRSKYPINPIMFKKAFNIITKNLGTGLIKPGHMEVALIDTKPELDEGWDINAV